MGRSRAPSNIFSSSPNDLLKLTPVKKNAVKPSLDKVKLEVKSEEDPIDLEADEEEVIEFAAMYADINQ